MVTGRETGHNVLQPSFPRGSASSSSYCHIKEAFILNIIIKLLINYIIIIFINYNAVVNNKLWNTPRPYCVFQNSHGHVEDFFENHRKFGHVPSQRFASPGEALT